MIRYFKTAAAFAVDLIFPELCLFCEGALGGTRDERRYLTCGKCFSGIRAAYNQGGVFCLLRYEGKAEAIVRQFKYHGVKRYAYCAGLLTAHFAGELKADALAAVPLFGARQRRRGYNQAEVMCGAISQESGVPVINALKRVKDTPPLYGLTKEARAEAVTGAFEFACETPIEGQTIILVDDVFTSGATFNECAKVLKAHGAAEVKLVAFAWTE